MREFKKYFFETLIQLAVLANVFRGTTRHSTHLMERGGVLQTIELNSTSGELDYLFLSENLNLNTAYQNNFSNEDDNINMNYVNSNYGVKEAEAFMNDIRFIQRMNRLATSRHSPNRNIPSPLTGNNQNFLFVAPASFSYTNNNQKELSRLSEARLLLNSLEQANNNNQFSKEVNEICFFCCCRICCLFLDG